MNQKGWSIAFCAIYLATVASKCQEELGTTPRQYGEPAYAGDPVKQSYGVAGDITQSEAPIVAGLVAPGTQPDVTGLYLFAQPQSRHAITSRIGFPASYAGNTDYYQLSRGNAEIVYDETGVAIGVRQPR